jgi:hypothetical protein
MSASAELFDDEARQRIIPAYRCASTEHSNGHLSACMMQSPGTLLIRRPVLPKIRGEWWVRRVYIPNTERSIPCMSECDKSRPRGLPPSVLAETCN